MPCRSPIAFFTPALSPFAAALAPPLFYTIQTFKLQLVGRTTMPPGFTVGVREAHGPLPDRLKPLLGECYPIYQILKRLATRPGAPPPPRPMLSPSPTLPSAASATADCLPTAPSDGGLAAGVASAAAAVEALALADGVATTAGPAGAGGGGEAGKAAGSCKGGTHAYVPDPRNADILIGIRDGVTGEFELVSGEGQVGGGGKAPAQLASSVLQGEIEVVGCQCCAACAALVK